MGQSIPETRLETHSLDGLDEFFSTDVKDPTIETPNETTPETVSATVFLTVSEARRHLGIPKSTLYRQIKEGRYETFQGEDGRLRLILSQSRDSSSQSRPSPETAPNAGQHVSLIGHLEIIREMQSKLEALTYRNGYLEAQLEQANKLLTDSEHKAGWWHRVWQAIKGSSG